MSEPTGLTKVLTKTCSNLLRAIDEGWLVSKLINLPLGFKTRRNSLRHIRRFWRETFIFRVANEMVTTSKVLSLKGSRMLSAAVKRTNEFLFCWAYCNIGRVKSDAITKVSFPTYLLKQCAISPVPVQTSSHFLNEEC